MTGRSRWVASGTLAGALALTLVILWLGREPESEGGRPSSPAVSVSRGLNPPKVMPGVTATPAGTGTAHQEVDYGMVLATAPMVFDARGVTLGMDAPNVVRL